MPTSRRGTAPWRTPAGTRSTRRSSWATGTAQRAGSRLPADVERDPAHVRAGAAGFGRRRGGEPGGRHPGPRRPSQHRRPRHQRAAARAHRARPRRRGARDRDPAHATRAGATGSTTARTRCGRCGRWTHARATTTSWARSSNGCTRTSRGCGPVTRATAGSSVRPDARVGVSWAQTSIRTVRGRAAAGWTLVGDDRAADRRGTGRCHRGGPRPRGARQRRHRSTGGRTGPGRVRLHRLRGPLWTVAVQRRPGRLTPDGRCQRTSPSCHSPVGSRPQAAATAADAR